MSSYLTNKAHILISSNADPTQDVSAIQFAPQTMKPSIESLATEDSGRSDDGIMHIYWVRRRIGKLEITLRPDTTENISAILDKVVGNEY